MNSNRKGKIGERQLSHELTRLFGVKCRRGQQFCGADGSADVVGLPGIHCECKRTNKLSAYKAMAQAVSDAEEGCVPVVFHRADRKEWLVICRLDDLPQLVEELT